MTDLSCGQVAKLLGVSRSTVWRWMERGYLLTPGMYVTHGGHLRFTPEAVKWLRREHGKVEG